MHQPRPLVVRSDNLIGRRALVDDLLMYLCDTEQQRGVAILRGEPGVGKTRVTLELQRRLAARGHAIVRLPPNARTLPSDMTSSQHTIVFVDDADACAVDVLEQLEHLAGPKLRLVLTHRLGFALGEYELVFHRFTTHGARVVDIPPLDESESRLLVRARDVDGGGRAPLTRRTVDEIVGATGGNPGAIIAAIARGSGAAGEPWVSDYLRRHALHLIGSLSAPSRRVIRVAALIGAAFELDLLQRVLGLRRDELLDALQESVDAGIVTGSENAPFAFTPASLAFAIASLVVDAKHLHATIARDVATWPETSATVERVARHWERAGESTRAFDAYERLGDDAMRANDVVAAQRAFARAHDLRASDGRPAPELCIKLGTALLYAGYDDEALTAFASALTVDDATARPDPTAYGELLLTQIGLAATWRGLPAVESLMRAFANLGLPPHGELALRTNIFYATCLIKHGESRRGLDIASASALAADRIGGYVQALLHMTMAYAHFTLAQASEAATELDRAHALAEFVPERTRSSYLANLAIMLVPLGRVDRATALFGEACSLAIATRSASKIAVHFSGHAELLLSVGRTAEAEAALMTAAAADGGTGLTHTMFASSALLVGTFAQNDLLVTLGLDETVLERGLLSNDAEQIMSVATAHAAYHWSQGRIDRAVAILERALEVLRDPPPQNWFFFFLVARLGTNAMEVRARALRHARTVAELSTVAAIEVLVEATNARRHGNNSGAALLGNRAARSLRAIGLPFMEAWACAVAGRRPAALKAFADLGCLGAVACLEQRAPSASALSQPLSRRERQVCALVVAGKSNGTIADELRISVRTVEHHMEAIFRKLDIRSRHQLAEKITADSAD